MNYEAGLAVMPGLSFLEKSLNINFVKTKLTMALNFDTQINSIMFLSELESISFTDSAHPATVAFAISDGEAVLFSNTYIPDDDGRVTIYDIDKVLESMMRTNSREVVFMIGDEEHACTVLKSSVRLDGTGESFASGCWLSPMMAPRYTCMGRYEVLYAYTTEETAVTAEAHYIDPATNKASVATYNLDPIDGLGYADCSPAQFEVADLVLVGYSVICGDRRAEYRMRSDLPEADPSLIYLNCFGVWETIYLVGAKLTEGQYDRQSAVIGGKLRSYGIGEVIRHKAKTGPMSDGAEALAYDLARSRSVFLLDADGIAGDEIVILDCDTQKSNEADHMPNFTFEYRAADRRTDKLSMARPPRIFDETFDETFN